MVAIFCLRLALGMLACLALLYPAQVPPRFYRVHYWIALAMTAVAAVFLWERDDGLLGVLLLLAGFWLLAGSWIWQLEGAPGQRLVLGLSFATLLGVLLLAVKNGFSWRILDDVSSAALLGSAFTAMLMGHSYLMAPAMSLEPLTRLLKAFAVCLAVRIVLAGAVMWAWTGQISLGNLETDQILWLASRWGLGFLFPLILGWMAWETARIRSTQSATGVLYVVVILVFIGEIISQLLLEKIGMP